MTEQARTEPVFERASDGDRADQEQVAIPALDDADDLDSLSVPLEADEADAVEQHQTVPPEPDEL